MTLSGSKSRCGTCGNAMQRWGRTAAGRQRWRCAACSRSAVRTRDDGRAKSRLSLFVSWLTSKASASELAAERGVAVQTLGRWFRPLWDLPPTPRPALPILTLVLDGTVIAWRECTLLIAGDNERLQPVSWAPAAGECHASWLEFLAQLKKGGVMPSFVVCDGQRGLLKAIRETWPDALVQRCLIHVVRQASRWLTRNPKTKAGADLLALVKKLAAVRTRRQKRKWIRAFCYWERRHRKFLKERATGPTGKWWYAHRKLRAARSLVRNAIPDLFRFVSDPTVPRTSNHVEGGCNGRIKELLRCHRGLPLAKKLVVASWYLALRQGQKPTRDVH